jgi:hypothetical protein
VNARLPEVPDRDQMPLSRQLAEIVSDMEGDRLTLHQLSERLNDRVWGGLLLIFAGINLLPLPPGFTTVTGIPLVLLTAQMALGARRPWFPAKVNRRGLSKKAMQLFASKMASWENRIERVLRPRMTWLTSNRAVRAIGAVGFVLSVILWLPIPLGNHAPAFSMSLFALALLYKDGLMVLAGAAATVASLAILIVAFGSAILAMLFAVQQFGAA